MADVLGLEQALSELRPLNAEVSVRPWLREPRYESGLIAFQPGANDPERQLLHPDRDVVCQVLRGQGRLAIDGEVLPVEGGTLCRIPAGTPHDFAASGLEPLVLFYTLLAVVG